MTPTNLALGTSEAIGILRARDPQAIVLLDGVLLIETEDGKPIVSTLKGVRFNMATLPNEVLYLL